MNITDERIAALEATINGYDLMLLAATTPEERNLLLNNILAKQNTLNRLLDAQAAAARAPAQVFPPPAAAIEVNESRKRRWDAINVILEANRKAKKTESGELSSLNYSAVTWKELAPAFDYNVYIQEITEIPDQIFANLVTYLTMVAKCFPDLTGNEAKRLYFICPIIVAVCSAFNGDVTILVEEDINGKRLKAKGRFEMVLKRGSKRVCIVEAKKDDMDQGLAQCSLGCEVASDLYNLEVVNGIVTNYLEWTLTRNENEELFREELSLDIDQRVPIVNSLKKITGKIYNMLSDHASEDVCNMKI